MYEGIKKAISPTQSKIALLKSRTGEVIKDERDQQERWVEHYSELYAKKKNISDNTLDTVEHLPVVEESDALPTAEGLSRAIDGLPTGKTLGLDGSSPEKIRCASRVLLSNLLKLLCQYWEDGSVLQDMRDCNIVTLYKNKGDKSDCNNY
ncbi:uncharacterized protein LOC106882555 [Octopus bimaculoides]|uniref:uncharacterized protein LOC106882555 n=1 Tax=Octopus bimaculoides TaxID=37653 RepID=UPI00071D99DD|nr:uncharacterized protein LOC106882555 [Octopus bimaculoides]|eukprot:XP_014788758.1 PREDICTED: uncharacterized protein LOC106882555 [Octopus bimaculoides]